MHSPIDSAEDRHLQHVDLDPYILDKHLNGLSSRSGNLLETDCDPSVNELFDESKSAYGWYEDDFDPRSIRPPPFSQHMKQVRDARMKLKETPRRSARIPVRTTKAERLKLARQRSISESNSSMPYLNPLNKSRQSKISPRSPNRQQPMPSMSRLSPLQMLKNNGYRHAESAQSCKDALDSKGPLLLSSMLIKQMRQDMKNNRGKSFDTGAISSILLFPSVPAYSKPLNSALLRERPHPPCSRRYQMKRVRHWLEKVIPTDYIEYNEYASQDSAIGTNFNDKLDDEYDLLADEKQSKIGERTYAEAHRALPLFQSEIHRKMQQHNLILTRLELDLYVL